MNFYIVFLHLLSAIFASQTFLYFLSALIFLCSFHFLASRSYMLVSPWSAVFLLSSLIYCYPPPLVFLKPHFFCTTEVCLFKCFSCNSFFHCFPPISILLLSSYLLLSSSLSSVVIYIFFFFLWTFSMKSCQIFTFARISQRSLIHHQPPISFYFFMSVSHTDSQKAFFIHPLHSVMCAWMSIILKHGFTIVNHFSSQILTRYSLL